MISIGKIFNAIAIIFIVGILMGCNEENTNPPSKQVMDVNQSTTAEKQDVGPGGGDGGDYVEYSTNSEDVKNSTLPRFSSALTVGQAFDGWKDCKNPSWEDRTGERGESLVLYKCTLNNDKISAYPDELVNKLKQVELAVMFAVSVDNESFNLASAASIYTFKDGKSYINEYPYGEKVYNPFTKRLALRTSPDDIVKIIYKNQILEKFISQNMYDERQ